MSTTLTLQTSFTKNIQEVFSVSEFLQQFLPGVKMVDRMGNAIPDSTIVNHIKRMTVLLENALNIKMLKFYMLEDMDFNRDDWYKWTYVHTHYPVVCAYSLNGFVGNVQQVQYPASWLTIRKTTDGIGYYRRVNIVPNNGGYAQVIGVLYSGIYPNAGYLNMNSIPNYWQIEYVTGWDQWSLPGDLQYAVGVLASISLLSASSFGMSPLFGLSEQSLSLDGLSQSVSTIQNSNSLLFGPLLKQYKEMFSGPDGILNALEGTYGGFEFAVG